MAGLKQLIQEIHRRSLWQVLLIYVGGAWACYELIDTVTNRFGLPESLPALAAILFLLGLPFVVATAFVREVAAPAVIPAEATEAQAARAEAAAARHEARRRRRFLTWRSAGLSFIAALAVWGLVATALLLFAERPGMHEPIESLAVLPLQNLSGDTDQEYFADGMTEALITSLAKIGALTVISRTSVMRYKQTDKPLPEIASELDVDAVVEGQVLRAGDRVRITAQLIEGATDRHLWAESYERDLRDILALQSEVAQAIAREIQLTLTPKDEVRLASAGPVNPEAHELYLKGRYHFNKTSKEGFEKAIEYYQKAIETDPNHAQAYAGLAESYGWLSVWGYLPLKEAYSKVYPPLRKALDLDETLPEAHVVLAGARFYWDYDWAEAEKAFKRTIELNPSFAKGHSEYAWYLSAMGRFAEAIAEAKRGLQLDPFSIQANWALSAAYYRAREYDQAIAQYQQAVELEPNDPGAYGRLAAIYGQIGMYEEAVRLHQKAMTLSGAPPEEVAALGRAYGESGPKGYWMWRLERSRTASSLANIYGRLGDKDQAFASLEKAYNERDGSLIDLKVSPSWDPLRSDPRFQDLLRRMNFPE